MSKRTGGIEVAKTRKIEEQGVAPALGGGQGDEGGRVTGKLAVLGSRRCIGLVG